MKFIRYLLKWFYATTSTSTVQGFLFVVREKMLTFTFRQVHSITRSLQLHPRPLILKYIIRSKRRFYRIHLRDKNTKLSIFYTSWFAVTHNVCFKIWRRPEVVLYCSRYKINFDSRDKDFRINKLKALS